MPTCVCGVERRKKGAKMGGGGEHIHFKLNSADLHMIADKS